MKQFKYYAYSLAALLTMHFAHLACSGIEWWRIGG